MTSALKSKCVSSYVLAAGGIIPSVFLDGRAEVEEAASIESSFLPVYNQGLILDVASVVGEIKNLVGRLSTSRQADFLVEAPVEAAYEDVYSQDDVKVIVYRDNSVPDLYDDQPDVWL